MAIDILAYEPTELGILCLRRRDLVSRPDVSVTEITLNHEFLMSSYLTESEKSLSRVGLEMVRKSGVANEGIRVLVGGLGLGYTVAEALAAEDVQHVEVVEYLKEVIGWMASGLVPLSEQLNAERRLKVTHGDVYARVTSAPESPFDLIAIDVDHSPEEVLGNQSMGFYTEVGLEKTMQHLATGGVLGVWSYAEDTPLLAKMERVFDEVHVEQVTVWNDLIHEETTDWLFFGRK